MKNLVTVFFKLLNGPIFLCVPMGDNLHLRVLQLKRCFPEECHVVRGCMCHQRSYQRSFDFEFVCLEKGGLSSVLSFKDHKVICFSAEMWVGLLSCSAKKPNFRRK